SSCPAPGSAPPDSASATRAPKRNAAQPASTHASSEASTPMKPRTSPSSVDAPITASSSRSVAVMASCGHWRETDSRMRADDPGHAEFRLHLRLQLVGFGATGDRADAHPRQRALVGGHGLGEGAEAGGAGPIAQ